MKYFLITLVFSIVLGACSSRPCREVSTENLPPQFLAKKESVFIYKYDGSLQCGQGQEISLDAMSKQLRDVKIISMKKSNDGMMRIQVCGSPTGNANVYEIQAKDLQKAKGYGFQEWNH